MTPDSRNSPNSPISTAPPEEMEDLDPGFARQRTELAWVRTALSFAGVGALALKSVPVAGGMILLVAIAVWVIGKFSRPYGPTTGKERSRLLFVVMVAMVGVSLIALLSTFFAAGSPLVPSTG